jgi:L-amino acid N-acyltransferase YncA
MKVSIVAMSTDDQWEWLYARATPTITPRSKGIVALREDGTILAAAVFDSWTRTSGQVHVAIDNPLAIRHGFVHECMDYFFNFCDRRIMIGLTPSNNTKSLKFNKKLGFVEVFRIEDGFDEGVDYVIQELRKENCRWINERCSRAA